LLIARAPLRISFAGGGTDLPAFYEREEGMIVSAAIAKYVYVMISSIPGQPIEITSSDYQEFYSQNSEKPLPSEGKLNLIYRVLDEFGFRSGVSVFVASEVPPGTGLGSSGALTVALVKALSVARGLRMDQSEVAELACEIEIERIGSMVGKQDQYASAFGGINQIRFSGENVSVEPLKLNHEQMIRLSSNLMLFFTGSSHSASEILAQQSNTIKSGDRDVTRSMKIIRSQADEAADIMTTNKCDSLGELMHNGWMVKRSLSEGVTTPFIDDCYEAAMNAGATGGKITGAGGGGFMLLYVRPPEQREVSRVLAQRGLTPMRCDFDSSGAMVLMNSGIPLNAKTH
jgi:D-glycero-alpha-D-manno-heptose-7-phosphate kinase